MKVISIRQQVESALVGWLQNSFSGHAEFGGVTFSKGQTSQEVTMPLISALCLSAEEVEVPGVGIYKADASLVLMTTIDRGSAPSEVERAAIDAEHKARADCVANKTEDIAGLVASINATNQVFVYGLDLGKSSHEVVERHYVDRFDLTLMCRCV